MIEIEFADATALWSENAGAHPAGATLGTDFEIQNVRVLASQVVLDSALVESFNRVLLSGRSLVFSYPTVHTQQSSVPNGVAEHNVTVARAFTKLMGAFVTFWDNDAGSKIHLLANPGQDVAPIGAASWSGFVARRSNGFADKMLFIRKMDAKIFSRTDKFVGFVCITGPPGGGKGTVIYTLRRFGGDGRANLCHNMGATYLFDDRVRGAEDCKPVLAGLAGKAAGYCDEYPNRRINPETVKPLICARGVKSAPACTLGGARRLTLAHWYRGGLRVNIAQLWNMSKKTIIALAALDTPPKKGPLWIQ